MCDIKISCFTMESLENILKLRQGNATKIVQYNGDTLITDSCRGFANKSWFRYFEENFICNYACRACQHCKLSIQWIYYKFYLAYRLFIYNYCSYIF